MMIARFRIVGWVAGCAGAALCCYLASQQVAAERLALAKVDREIADTRADNARLETEIATRSRLGQIERWNVAFRLGAPSPRQFFASEVQLAAYVGGRDGARALPLDPAIAASKGAIDTVAYVKTAPPVAATIAAPAPSAVAPAPPRARMPVPILSAPTPRLQTASTIATPQEPMLRTATYVRPTTSRLAATEPALVKASLKIEPATRTRPLHLAGLLDDVPGHGAGIGRPGSLPSAPFEQAAPGTRSARRQTAALLPGDLAALAAAEGKAGRTRPGKAER